MPDGMERLRERLDRAHGGREGGSDPRGRDGPPSQTGDPRIRLPDEYAAEGIPVAEIPKVCAKLLALYVKRHDR